ncbi:MAG: hypothetical protein K0S41_1350 [Anaerocolumna sp.]|nr:hypothetical protein [Anaerocolumna sp.]
MGNDEIKEIIYTKYGSTEYDNDIKNKRWVLSKIGYSLFIMVLMIQFVQTVSVLLVRLLAPRLWEQPWMTWVLVVVGFYATSFPVFCLLVKKVPSIKKAEPKEMKLKELITAFLICMAATYIFNYFTIALNSFIGFIIGEPIKNPLSEAITSSNLFYTFIFACIVAPIFEEITFRGILLSKLRIFGDKTAIWLTALAFGLFHLNLFQFFYATVLGIIFAYVAIKTNRIKYTIILHICINTMGSIIMPNLALSGNRLLISLAGVIIILLLVTGIGLFIKEKKNITFEPPIYPLESSLRRKLIYGNNGILSYIILCSILTVLVLFV